MKLARAELTWAWFASLAEDSQELSPDVSDWLTELWACCDDVGISGSSPNFENCPTDLPAQWRGKSLGFLQAMKGEGYSSTRGLRQAFAFCAHDLVGIVTCISASESGPQTLASAFEDLANRWDPILQLRGVSAPTWPGFGTTAAHRSTQTTVPLFTEAKIYAGLVSQDLSIEQLEENLAREVSNFAIPGPLGGIRAERDVPLVARLAHDCTAVIVGAWENYRASCSIVALASESAESALDSWIWWQSESYLAPLLAYLAQVAKARYERAVYEHERATFVRRRSAAELAIRKLADALPKLDPLGPRTEDIEALASHHREVHQAVSASGGLLATAARLRDLETTLAIAEDNMARRMSEVTSAPPQTLFGRDRLVVQHALQQIHSDLGYADAIVRWSDGLERQTDMILGMRDTLRARTQERLTLTQTSVLGAVIAALAVVAAVHVNMPGPEAVQWSMVAVVFFLGLGLPALVMHRSEGYQGADALLAGLFLASLCGLSYALFTWNLWLGIASAGISVLLVVGGAWFVIANWRRKPKSTSMSI